MPDGSMIVTLESPPKCGRVSAVTGAVGGVSWACSRDPNHGGDCSPTGQVSKHGTEQQVSILDTANRSAIALLREGHVEAAHDVLLKAFVEVREQH